MILTFAACANHTDYDESKEKSETQVKISEQGSEIVGGQETEEMTGEILDSSLEVETVAESETETEMMTDFYEPVEVSELDYDSFQSRMTDEEWEGFQQYFPVLKENAAFHYTDFGDGVELNKDGEPLKEGEQMMYERYMSEEIMDINQFVESYSEDNNREWKVEDIRVFDLDEDGVQELIIQWTPVGEILVLHRENEEFYGWGIMYRGFEVLQTNGVYISSGGAGSNRWKRIRFENGSWMAEVLAWQEWGEYYLHGEPVDEDTFFQQVELYETGDVTRYAPMQSMDGIATIYRSSEDNDVMKTYYEMEDGTWKCEGKTYSLRLELSGRMPNAVKDSGYVVLTDNAELTFDDVTKSMISSSSEDSKIMEGSVLVELR
ncbi:MAG: hypothetical protein K2N90_09710 [Lachnospiraceae bacterium]|nr:hypothetical protein [Lachnospiraceae bacterium]